MKLPVLLSAVRPPSIAWTRLIALLAGVALLGSLAGCVSKPIDSTYESTWDGYSPKAVPSAVSDK